MAEQACQQCGDNDTQGGQEHRLDSYGACSLPFGPESAVKHDKNQCNGAELFCDQIVAERDFKQSVRAENHTKSHEAQKCGHSKFAGKTICYDAGEDDGTA